MWVAVERAKWVAHGRDRLRMNAAGQAAKFLRLASRRRAVLPTEVQIEVTNVCNLSCPMCPHTFGGLPIEDMPRERFERILAQVPFARDIILTGWGEPLMHKDFLGLLDLCRELRPDAKVRFTTNGYLLNGKLAREVLDRGVSRVAFSFDEVPPEGPASAAVAGTLGHVPSRAALDNAERFCGMRSGRAVRVHYQVAILVRNEPDILALVAHASRAGADAVALLRLETWNRPELVRPDLARERAVVAAAKREGRAQGVEVLCLNDHSLAMRLATHDDELCLKTDASVYIDVRGNVTPCCNLRDFVGGNVETGTVAAAWESERFRGFFRGQRAVCGGCDALQSRHFGA